MRLSVQHCSKEVSGRVLFDNVSFSVASGEIVAIMGGSGCGKSTLLRVLCGFDHGGDGSITVDGKGMEDLGYCAWRRQVMYCAQERPAPGFCNTPLEMAGVVGKLAAVRNAGLVEEAVEMAAQLGISRSTFSSRWGSLSGGERARCHLAISLAQRPPFLLLDEPTAALDSTAAELVEAAVLASGAGVVWVTHSLEQARRCDRVVVMENGGLSAEEHA